MKLSLKTAIAAASVAAAAVPGIATAENGPVSIPSVIVTAENSAPSRGAVQTPIWIGVHDGSFDIYDRNVPLGSGALISRESVERLAEDGSTGPITEEFASLLPGSPQATVCVYHTKPRSFYPKVLQLRLNGDSKQRRIHRERQSFRPRTV